MSEEIRARYHSIQDIVFTTLRDEITNHILKPGEALNTVELSKRLGVSRTPIREALNRLISIGLVEETPHHSPCVKTMSADQLVEIYYIRAALMGVAARLAAGRLATEQHATLKDLCDRMEKMEGSDQSKSMLELNREFHSIINAAANSPQLEELLEQYYSQSRQYRELALGLPGRSVEICAEHRRIADALALRDRDEAEAATRDHYFNTAKRIALAFGIDTNI
ncbi:MAG: GntR family transcriptional regulator [Spirochaetes bacterium]|nr:GntR family transcriptional regulator [Spirochaetota bacterium]